MSELFTYAAKGTLAKESVKKSVYIFKDEAIKLGLEKVNT